MCLKKRSVFVIYGITLGMVLVACGSGGTPSTPGTPITLSAPVARTAGSSILQIEQRTITPAPTTLPTSMPTPRLNTLPAAVPTFPLPPTATHTVAPATLIPPTITSTPEQPTPTPVLSTATATPVWAIFPDMPAMSYTANALYQPFEHGFMVWRSDANCVYALAMAENATNTFRAVIPSGLTPYSYCLTVDPLPAESEAASPPSGLLLPTGVLGKVWSFYPDVREALGYALQPESSYLSTIPVVNDLSAQDGMVWAIPQMTLLDGHILACGARGASAGVCFWMNTE